eukprot:Gb_14869 [translate_table: standard]
MSFCIPWHGSGVQGSIAGSCRRNTNNVLFTMKGLHGRIPFRMKMYIDPSNLITACRAVQMVQLVERLEQWSSQNGVEYAYVATEKDNERLCTETIWAQENFFPQDIEAILKNKLSLDNWVAAPRGQEWPTNGGRAPKFLGGSQRLRSSSFKLRAYRGNESAAIDEGFVLVCPQFGQRDCYGSGQL